MPPELLRVAAWRASRFGLAGELIDVRARRSIPAPVLVEAMLKFLRPWLEEGGEWDEIEALVRKTEAHGTGASRQREALSRGGRMEDMVNRIVEETERGVV